jgi:hypothetical protein
LKRTRGRGTNLSTRTHKVPIDSTPEPTPFF